MVGAVEDDRAEPGIPWYVRAAVPALAIEALLSVAAVYAAFAYVGHDVLLRLALSGIPLFLVAVLLTRHVFLAFFVAAAPLAGVLWGQALCALFHAPASEPALAAAFGSLLALFYASAFEMNLLEMDDPAIAMRAAFAATW